MRKAVAVLDQETRAGSAFAGLEKGAEISRSDESHKERFKKSEKVLTSFRAFR
jgi:hypothetical protein